MVPSAARIDDAKRALGRALRAQEGFVGVRAGGIRLYARSEEAQVVRYFRSRYGRTYRGSPVSIVPSSGLQTTRVGGWHLADGAVFRRPRVRNAYAA